MTRQYKWQQEQKRRGLCVVCAQPAVNATHCLKHAIIQRERMRQRAGSVKRNDALSYRLEKSQPPFPPLAPVQISQPSTLNAQPTHVS